MNIGHQTEKTTAYRAFNKANKVGKESNNQRSGKVSTCDPYLISGYLSDFRSLCIFSYPM